ncbi:MAG: hypothetical protein HY290_17610 [Planctomycetia bacterium]|nr:hypothetical protein [Planctomycetia bacterium]
MPDTTFLPDPDFDDAPRKQGDGFKTVAIALSIVGGILMMTCCGVGAVVYFTMREQFQQFQQAILDNKIVMPPAEYESIEQRRADLKAGFGADQPQVDPATLAGVTSFFERVVQATRDSDEVKFRALVDGRRFMDEVKKRGVLKELTEFSESYLISDFQNRWISIPGSWTRFHIANVKLAGNGNDAVVYVYFWDETQWIFEVRFWITRTGIDWRAYDWEVLEYGIRVSLEAAVYTQYGEHEAAEHLKALGELHEAYELFNKGDAKAAVGKMNQAEKRVPIPELADNLAVQSAYTWRSLGKPRSALAAARRVRVPGIAAGALHAQASVYREYGLYRRALEFALKYEEAVGGGPGSDDLLAALNDSLDNRQSAFECRTRLLRIDPDNAGALTSLALAADESQRQIVIELVQRTSQPADRAAGLVTSVASGGDLAVARALVEFLVQAEPDSARAALAQGRMASAEGEFERAAGFYRTALERNHDDESREEYLSAYLDAMTAAGKAREAYEQSPDQKAAFRHLVGGTGDDDDRDDSNLPPETLRALCDAHRASHANDPWLHYQDGLNFERESNTEAAEREFRAAIEHGEEAELPLFRGALFSLLDQAGRTLDAYTGVFPADESFPRLVQIHRWKHVAGDLEEVCRRHRETHPGDPWLDSCAAILQQKAGNSHEALRLARHGYEAAADDSIKLQYRWQVVDLAIEAGDLEAVYQVAETADEALRILTRHAQNPDSKLTMQSILDQHRKTRPITSLWKALQAQEQWKLRDFQGVVNTVGPNPEQVLRDLSDWDAGDLANVEFQSLWQLGLADSARRLAETVYDDWGKARSLLYVHARGRNLPAVERLLSEFGNDTWKVSATYNEPEVGAILRSAEFLPVRRLFPPPAAVPSSAVGVVLLLDGPANVTAESLQAAARIVLGDDVAVEQLAAPPGVADSGIAGRWLLASDRGRIAIAAGTNRYFVESDVRGVRPQSESLSGAIARHNGWISLCDPGSKVDAENNRAASSQVDRLAARLRDDHCLAIQLLPEYRLIENSPELAAKLESDDPRHELSELGEVLWLERGKDPQSRTQRPEDLSFRRSLATFDRAFESRTEEQSFELGILLSHEDLSEVLKLQVTSASRAPYRGRTYRGTLVAGSKLWPELAAGEPVSVSEYQIVEWSYTKGDQVERATRW